MRSGTISYAKGGRLDADFIRLDGTNLLLRFAYGGAGSLPIASLSEADRAFVAEVANRKPEARKVADPPAAPPEYDSIATHRDLLMPIHELDFPKTDQARAVCQEITSELGGVERLLELGISYGTFSDVLTEKVLSIEKIKGLRGTDIPPGFLYEADQCVDRFAKSKEYWSDQLNTANPKLKPLLEFHMLEERSEAGLHFNYCVGMARSDTNANTTAAHELANIIRAEQDAVELGILESKEKLDPVVHNMTSEEIFKQIMRRLTPTNSAPVEVKP